MMKNQIQMRTPTTIPEEKVGPLERELSIQKSFFNSPVSFGSDKIILGENTILCPRPPIELFHSGVKDTKIWKTQDQLQQDNAEISGQPLPICAIGNGNLVNQFGTLTPLENYVMLNASTQPSRTFYINNVKFDVYHINDISCVLPKSVVESGKVSAVYKDNPPKEA